MTEGNSHQRYIGVTDEPLCEEGRKLLEKFTYPAVQALFVSPLKRCRETASILFPKGEQRIVPLLAECDFGEFENKNYKELSDNPHYQEWIDSNGTLPFPGGESREEFQARCLEGFSLCIEHCIQYQYRTFAMVIHGGTIMSILDGFAVTHRDYFDWQVKNLEGYEIETDEKQWVIGSHEIYIRKEGSDIWK